MNGRRWGFLLLVVFLTAGFWASRDDDLFELRKNFEIFGAVYETLAGRYVDAPEPAHLMQAGIEAMLDELDPYTVFLNEADVAGMRLRRQKGYGDVGVTLGRRGDRITVLAPQRTTGAYRQGVRTGDVLLRVDGTSTEELSLSDVYALLRGQPGTTVPVVIGRPGAVDPLRFVVTRRKPDDASVSQSGLLAQDERLGYVKLDYFGTRAAAEVRTALEAMQEEGPLQGVVLDLRDNPGGRLEQAVAIAGLFVEKGQTVVTVRGRTQESTRSYQTRQPPLAPSLPVVVLVNSYSASASEIVAGALQDLDRGVIMGDTTYGKGLVQALETLPYNTALKVTVARYYTPSGRCIQATDYRATPSNATRRLFRTAHGRPVYDGRGIAPDILSGARPPGPLEEALRRRASFFLYASDYASRHRTLPSDFFVDKALLEDFRTWLEAHPVAYASRARKRLEALRRELAATGIAADGELDALARALEEAARRQFVQEAEALQAALRPAILARYLNQEERRASLLDHDPVVQRARLLLGDREAYREVLR